MNEDEILDRALNVINEALDGKFVHPQALDTAIRMTQFMWTSVYTERVNRLMIENKKDDWNSDTILHDNEK